MFVTVRCVVAALLLWGGPMLLHRWLPNTKQTLARVLPGVLVTTVLWLIGRTERARRSGQGLTTVVMCLLVPHVKLDSQLHLARAAERWSGQLRALIEQRLRRG